MHTASSGPDALAMAAKNAYDVILMDINMTRMGGLACLEELKKANRIQVSYEKGTRRDGTEFDDKSKPFLLLIGDDKPKETTSSEPSVEETMPEINGEP